MDKEKTAMDNLVAFAKRTGRHSETKEHIYPTVQGRQNFRQRIVIKDNENPSIYFISFLDSKEFGKYGNYSGFFFTIPKANKLRIKAVKKHFLNKINLFKNEDSFRTGNSEFDKQILVTTDNADKARPILKDPKVLKQIEIALLMDPRMRAGVNNLEIPFVEEFKGKGVFGMFIVQTWIEDENRIEELFRMAREIHSLIGMNTIAMA